VNIKVKGGIQSLGVRSARDFWLRRLLPELRGVDIQIGFVTEARPKTIMSNMPGDVIYYIKKGEVIAKIVVEHGEFGEELWMQKLWGGDTMVVVDHKKKSALVYKLDEIKMPKDVGG